MEKKMNIGILLFDNFTALDVIGPYDVLCRMPDTQVYFIGPEKRVYKDSYGLGIDAGFSIHDIEQTDVILVPGGTGIDDLLTKPEIVEWINKVHAKSILTTAVCAGSLLLAQAGLLNNKKCTTHWRRKDQLGKYKVNMVNERYVQDGKIVTSAGVSAGIDMAIYLVSILKNEITARLIQLALEYDPKPPFDCGSPGKATPEMLNFFKK